MQEFITIPTSLISELPDDKRLALLDILLMADENGQVQVSERELMSRWKWSNTKVRKFLEYLQEKSTIKAEKKQKKSTEILINTEFIGIEESRKKAEKKQKKSTEKEEDTEIYKRIIEHLNMVCGTNYRHNTESSRKDIRARLNEGYKEDDFYIVIDKKAKEWMGTEQEKYLRPMTLFGPKFESYLNQIIVKGQKTESVNATKQSQLEYLLNSIREDEMNEYNGG